MITVTVIEPLHDQLKLALDRARMGDPDTFVRTPDQAIERHMDAAGRVQLRLLTTLGTARIGDWLGFGRATKGSYEFKGYRIATRTALADGRNGQPATIGTRQWRVHSQPLAYCREDGFWFAGGQPAPKVVRVSPGIAHPTGTVYSWCERDYWLAPNLLNLVDLYQATECLPSQESAVQVLSTELRLGCDGSASVPTTDSRLGWRCLVPPDDVIAAVGSDIQSQGIPGCPLGPLRLCAPLLDRQASVAMLYLSWDVFGGWSVSLPMTFWHKRGDPCLYALCVAPTLPAPLFNSEQLKDPQATPVLLFDSIRVAALMGTIAPSGAAHWGGVTSWHGGREAVGRVDWSLLRGRDVHYVICNHSGLPKDYALGTAACVHERLLSLGIRVRVHDLHAPGIGTAWSWAGSAPRWVGQQELESHLPSGGRGPEQQSGQPRILSIGADVAEERPRYLLAPVIAAGALTVISAEEGVIGTTWLALHLACSLACGRPVFGVWTPEGRHSVLYVNNKMDEPALVEHTRIAARAFAEGDRQWIDRHLSLACLGADAGDLSTAAAQHLVRGFLAEAKRRSGTAVSLLVLDSVCAPRGLGEPATERALSLWLGEIRREGIAALFIQHHGRPGTRGGGRPRTSGVANTLHVKAETSVGRSTVAMAISVERRPGVLQAGRRSSFVVEFVPSAKSPKWRVRRKASGRGKASDEKRNARILELVRWEWSNLDIADDIGMNINTLKALKRKLGCVRLYRMHTKADGQDGEPSSLPQGWSGWDDGSR